MWKPATPVNPVLIRWGIRAFVIIAVISWLRWSPPTAPWSPQAVRGYILGEPRTITKIERVDVPGPVRIRTIVKEKIVEKYRDLPTSGTLNDNTASVIAVAAIPPSPDGGVALAVLKPGVDNVGVGSIEYRPATPTFFKVKREMGIRGGYGTEGIMGELYARPVRVGPVEVEGRVYGVSGNGESNFGAAVMLDWRF